MSAPITMFTQFKNAKTEMDNGAEQTNNKPREGASSQPRVITPNGKLVSKCTEQSQSLSIKRPPTPNSQVPTTTVRTLLPSDLHASNRNYRAVTPCNSTLVRNNPNKQAIQAVNAQNITDNTDVVKRTVPDKRLNDGISLIPRAQNSIRPPGAYPVRGYESSKQKWRSTLNDSAPKVITTVTTTAKPQTNELQHTFSTKACPINNGLKKERSAPNDKQNGISNEQRTPIQVISHWPSATKLADTALQTSRPLASSSSVVTDRPTSIMNQPRDSSRVTIIRADPNDSTVNSELSDFDNESVHQFPQFPPTTGPPVSHRGSFLLYSKPLNERVLSTLSEDVGWSGPDRHLTFTQPRNSCCTGNNYAHGLVYNSMGNLSSVPSVEYHHMVQRLPSNASYSKQKSQVRQMKYMNQYKSTPDIFKATRIHPPTKIPFRSTSQDPKVNGSLKELYDMQPGMQRNYRYGGSTGYIPNPIPETDDSQDEETETYATETPELYPPQLYSSEHYTPTTLNTFRFNPTQNAPTMGYPVAMERDPVTSRRRAMTAVSPHFVEQTYNYATDGNNLRVYDESSLCDDLGDEPHSLTSRTTPKPFRKMSYDHRQREHSGTRRFSGSQESAMGHLGSTRPCKDNAPDALDMAFFQRRRSVNLPNDFDYMDPHWRMQIQTTGPDFRTKPQERMFSSSTSNQMHFLINDPGYVHVRVPSRQETKIPYGVHVYQRETAIPRSSAYLRSCPPDARPRSLCDNLAMLRQNADVLMDQTIFSPTARQQPMDPFYGKPYYRPPGRKTYSEWDISRVGLDDSQPNLHPDSYIHNRPNIRRGFGGNYTRPNACLLRTDWNGRSAKDHTNRSQSLERTPDRSTPYGQMQSGKPPPQSSQQPFRTNASVGRNGTSSRQSSPTTSSVSSQSTNPPRVDNAAQLSPSPVSRASKNTITRPGSKTVTYSLTPPLITWREKTAKELQSDEKLKNLLMQLPAELLETTSIVLLLMSLDPNEHYNCGLESRLREAFQLTAPERSLISELKEMKPAHGFSVVDETGSAAERKLALTGERNIDSDESSDVARKLTDPRMAQACYPPRNQLPLESSELKPSIASRNRSDSDTSIASDMDMAVSNSLSDESAAYPQPNVSTVLRRLARCMTERLTWKRHQLADAEQRVNRNSSEQKWLRNKLIELFTGSEHNSSTNLFSHSQTTLDGTETPIGNVVVRFDRWHNNTLEAVKLLCHLSRRLAYLDARIKCLNCQSQRDFHWSDPDPKQTMEELKNRQHHLQEQIKEAQDLRVNQENCRLRLLESIPPGLRLTESWSVFGTHCLSTPSVIPNGNSEEKTTADDTVTSPAKMDQNYLVPVLLRDRISLHLATTMQWLVTYHVLETEIFVDQEICDSIQDQQRLVVTY